MEKKTRECRDGGRREGTSLSLYLSLYLSLSPFLSFSLFFILFFGKIFLIDFNFHKFPKKFQNKSKKNINFLIEINLFNKIHAKCIYHENFYEYFHVNKAF